MSDFNRLSRFIGLSMSVHFNHVDGPSILFSNDGCSVALNSVVFLSVEFLLVQYPHLVLPKLKFEALRLTNEN